MIFAKYFSSLLVRLWLAAAVLLPAASSYHTLLLASEAGLETHAKTTAKTKTNLSSAYDLPELSARIRKLQYAAREFLGANEIYIAGGSARSVAKTIVLGQKLTFRDLDMIIVANRPVTEKMARDIAEIFESRGIGDFSLANLRPRPRANAALPLKESAKYNAGHGFFLETPDKVVIDISIFHSEIDLKLNGLMDVDALLIPLPVRANFLELLEGKVLGQNGKPFPLRDPYQALGKVLGEDKSPPTIVNWAEIERDPHNVVIRVVRSLAKFHALPMADEIASKRLAKILGQSQVASGLQICRNLDKLLADDDWLVELASLKDLGLFDHVFPSIKALLVPGSELQKELSAAVNAQNAESSERLVAFLKFLSPIDRLNFLKFILPVRPEILEGVLSSLQSENTSHGPNTPNAPSKDKDKYKDKEKIKLGYFTGEFAPFHNGHKAVVDSALKSKEVDFVFIVPSPHVSNDPKTPEFSYQEWQERRNFVTAGTQAEPNMMLWPPKLTSQDSVALGDVIKNLDRQFPSQKKLTHIFGGDSLHRVIDRNLFQIDPRPRIAVSRPGVPLSQKIMQKNLPDLELKLVENQLQDPVSSSFILHEMAAGTTSKNLHPKVAEQLEKTNRYQLILNDLRNTGRLIKESASASTPPSEAKEENGQILLIDPRINYCGLFQENTSGFSNFYADLLKHLEKLSPKGMFVISESDEIQKDWQENIKDLNLKMPIAVGPGKFSFPTGEKAIVIHSGAANDSFSYEWALDYFLTDKRRLIIFETDDRPASPLIKLIPKVSIIHLSSKNNEI